MLYCKLLVYYYLIRYRFLCTKLPASQRSSCISNPIVFYGILLCVFFVTLCTFSSVMLYASNYLMLRPQTCTHQALVSAVRAIHSNIQKLVTNLNIYKFSRLVYLLTPIYCLKLFAIIAPT